MIDMWECAYDKMYKEDTDFRKIVDAEFTNLDLSAFEFQISPTSFYFQYTRKNWVEHLCQQDTTRNSHRSNRFKVTEPNRIRPYFGHLGVK